MHTCGVSKGFKKFFETLQLAKTSTGKRNNLIIKKVFKCIEYEV